MKHVVINKVYFCYHAGAVDGKRPHVVVKRRMCCAVQNRGWVILAGRVEVRPATEADYERFKIAL